MKNFVPDQDSATIFDIQRFSLHDGPGIRTTVFLKGCSLRCVWCQNPESHLSRPQPAFYPEKCTGCLTCETACPEGAILTERHQRIDHAKCTLCGQCLTVCPEKSITMVGKAWKSDDLVEEILKDIDFFKNSKGGVTFSGGEPMRYPEFLIKVIKELRSQGIHINIETCGDFNQEKIKPLLPLLDMIYFDLKHMDSKIHKKFTGRENELILENFSFLSQSFPALQARMPIVPTINDTKENITQTAQFLKDNNHDTIHCLPFHNMGEAKLARIKTTLSPLTLKTMSPGDCDTVKALFATQTIEAIVYD